MKKQLRKPNDSPAAVTLAMARELATRFPPKFLADKIGELLNAKLPAKMGKDGKTEEPRINERAVESGIKLFALLQQLASNEVRLGGEPLADTETDAEVMQRLANSPSARKAAASFLAGFDKKGTEIIVEECDEA